MSLSGRPLLDTRVDAALFVDRDDERRRLAAAVTQGYNTLVWGDAGIGKTSFVRTVGYQLRPQTTVHYVRVEGMSRADEVLRAVAATALGARDGAGEPDIESVLETLGREKPRRVVVVDDISAEAGHQLFGRFRDQLWALQWTWIVVARTEDKGGLLMPPANAFFERVIELGPLSADAAVELIRRRNGKRAPKWVSQLAASGVGNPRRLLAVARDVAENGGDGDGIVDSLGRRAAAIQALGRPESMLAAELEALGAASASDEVLLDRLGWTRARAAQVFARLEQAGLVTSDEVRSGTGRPRRVFRLTPAAHWAT